MKDVTYNDDEKKHRMACCAEVLISVHNTYKYVSDDGIDGGLKLVSWLP